MSTELALSQKSPIMFSDGFSRHQSGRRVVRGQLLKQIDGRTTVGGLPFADRELLVQDVAQVGQYFPDDGPPESFFIDEENPISRIAELNSNIPETDWRIGLSGKPEEPWKLNSCIYLVDERDGSTYTMLNSTVGMKIANARLRDHPQAFSHTPGGLPAGRAGGCRYDGGRNGFLVSRSNVRFGHRRLILKLSSKTDV